MRRLARVVLCLPLLAVLAGCVSVPVTTTSSNDADAQGFVDKAIVSIFGHWNVDALVAAADKNAYNAQRVRRARDHFHQWSAALGAMTGYHGAQGTTEILQAPGKSQSKSATYTAHVTYERGKAIIFLRADKRAGKWLTVDASVQPLPSHRPPPSHRPLPSHRH